MKLRPFGKSGLGNFSGAKCGGLFAELRFIFDERRTFVVNRRFLSIDHVRKSVGV
jgi:hypothetical protein